MPVLNYVVIILLLFCCLPFKVFGEDVLDLSNDFSIELLTADDGFVSSQIYSIVQDKQGLLWFGTGENGVMRFDGRKVTAFEFDSESENGLSHNDAGNLMLDRDGRIWIGTWGGGINVYNPQTGLFKSYIHNKNDDKSLSANRIQSLYDDSTSGLWFGSYANGLNHYLGDGQFKRYQKQSGRASSLSHNRVWDIEHHDKGSLWIATSFGLNLFNHQAETFQLFLPQPSNNTPTGGNEIRNILKTKGGKFIVGTQLGPYLFDHQSGQFTMINDHQGNPLGQVNSMIEDQLGDTWIVTSSGLYRYSNEQIEKLSLPHESGLRIIFEDRTGILWLTNEVHGIYKIMPTRQFKAISHPKLVSPNGLAIDNAGDVLILSATAELFKWQVEAGQLSQLSGPIFDSSIGFKENRLLEKPFLLQASDYRLWVAQDDVFGFYDLEKKQFQLVSYPKSDPKFSEFRELRVLSEDRLGNIWIGTYKSGVYIYNPKVNSFVHLDESYGLTHPEVLEIFSDSSDKMWVGTGNGVSLWHEETQRFIQYQQDETKSDSLAGAIVQDIHQSRDGEIWIATQRGLNLFIPKTQSFKHFDKSSGLATSLIRAVQDDQRGNLWLTTNKGVSRLNPSTGSIQNFDSYDGLRGLNYYTNSLARTYDETIFTSSQRGIEYFNTTQMQADVVDSKIVLTGFNIMGQPAEIDKPLSYVRDIYLSYLDYFFSFEFAVLDFISPNKNQYAYKLEGFDKQWIEIGNRNVATFTNLDGGQYTLLVKATNSAGKWGEHVLKVNVHVASAPWKSWWAYTLYFLLSVVFVSLFIVFRTRLQQNEIKRQKQFVQALEEQVAEKTASLNAQAKDLLEANKKLEMLTFQDGLTGLYNRRYFDQCLVKEINRHGRDKNSLSLILCDIDHFKAYNDHYGHVTGDTSLKQIAEVIKESICRTSDASCRYGGEEFAIILPSTNKEQALYVAERLRLNIEKLAIPHKKSTTNDFVTVTLGVVTVIPDVKTSSEQLIGAADKALYQGKNQGRNRIIQVP